MDVSERPRNMSAGYLEHGVRECFVFSFSMQTRATLLYTLNTHTHWRAHTRTHHNTHTMQHVRDFDRGGPILFGLAATTRFHDIVLGNANGQTAIGLDEAAQFVQRRGQLRLVIGDRTDLVQQGVELRHNAQVFAPKFRRLGFGRFEFVRGFRQIRGPLSSASCDGGIGRVRRGVVATGSQQVLNAAVIHFGCGRLLEWWCQ
jgi:hypothetical protein